MKRLNIEVEFLIGDKVYRKADNEAGIVVELVVTPLGVEYHCAFADSGATYYGMELSDEQVFEPNSELDGDATDEWKEASE